MPVDPFLAFLQQRAGPGLRVVTWYASDDFDVLYVRDDLNPEEIVADVSEHAARLDAYPAEDADPLTDRIGPERATVQVGDNAVLIRFPIRQDRGLAVELEPDVARDLHPFVTTCVDQLDETELTARGAVSR